MNDETVTNDNEGRDASNRSSVGKIARLPNDIREQLNQRLLDGQPADVILPWLNDLPLVKAILAAQFDGAPISRQNLDKWRHGGYRDWLKEWKSAVRLQRAGKYAAKISRAGRGKIAAGAATLIAHQILELFDTATTGQHSLSDLAKMAFAITALRNADQSDVRLKHGQTRVFQGNEWLVLEWDKHMRDCVATAQRVLGDALAKEIQDADIDNAEKIELLGHHLFGKKWYGRKLPEPEPPVSLPIADEQPLAVSQT
jgi:hypothetical protein